MTDSERETTGLPAVISESRKGQMALRTIHEQFSVSHRNGYLAPDPEGGEADTLVDQVEAEDVVYLPMDETVGVDFLIEAFIEEMYQRAEREISDND